MSATLLCLPTILADVWLRPPPHVRVLAVACVVRAAKKNPFAISSIVLALSASGFVIAASVAEERENLVCFGAAYAA